MSMSPTTVHIKLAAELKAKLDEMAKADRRDKTDFIRLLIEDEWNARRDAKELSGQLNQKGNGDQR